MSNKNITGVSRRIAFRAPNEVADAIDDKARATGQTVSEVMVAIAREALIVPVPLPAGLNLFGDEP